MPWGGVLARFIGLRGGGFELLFCPEDGEFAHLKITHGNSQAWN